MKRFVAFTVLLALVLSTAWAENTSLQSANTFYDQNNYKSARERFLEAIRGGVADGTTLYRLAYSTEMLTSLDSEVVKKYALARVYLGKEGKSDNKYYLSSEKKVRDINPGLLDLSESDQAKILDEIKTEPDVPVVNRPVLAALVSSILQIVLSENWWILIGILLVFYIVAQILTSTTSCIIVWGWWDLIILLVPGCILLFYFLAMKDGTTATQKVDLPLTIAFFVFLLGTIGLTVFANRGPKWAIATSFSMVSILAKLAILLIMPVVAFLFVAAAMSGQSDRRYRDGTKGNERTAMLAIAGAIGFFLVGNLIKVDQDD